MKLTDLISVANRGYTKDFPESSLLTFVDERGEPNGETGDTMATFIVTELFETFDPDASDGAQVDEAVRVMERARRDLDNLIACLENSEPAVPPGQRKG